MNEMIVLDFFYDELRATGQTRNTLFISLDELVVTKLKNKLGVNNIQLTDLHKLADICIANEWLERTTADPGYRYLSLTEAGLQMAISYQYRGRGKN
jgi:hypothetical protein